MLKRWDNASDGLLFITSSHPACTMSAARISLFQADNIGASLLLSILEYDILPSPYQVFEEHREREREGEG